MPATVRDLKPALQSDVFLWCPCCDARYSATAGDYWNFPDDYAFICDECDGQPMELAREKRTIHLLT